jgi:thiol-disulfide isomerase/thioredoxin
MNGRGVAHSLPLWRRGVRIALSVVAVAGLLAACAPGSDPAPGPSPFHGSGFAACPTARGPAPAKSLLAAIELTCMDGSGSRFTPGAPLGRPVILTLWGSWCPPCGEELPAFSRLIAAHPDKLIVVGIDTEDSATTSISAAKDIDVRFANAFDRKGRVRKALKAHSLPVTVFLDEQGTIVYVNSTKPLDDASLRAAVIRYLKVPL